MLHVVRTFGLIGLVASTTWAAPPYTGRVGPLTSPKGPIGVPGPLETSPSLFDRQMLFDFRTATQTKSGDGVNLKVPGKPTAAAQGIIWNLFHYGIAWRPPGSTRSALIVHGQSTDKLGYVEFRSNAFELNKRKELNLSWQGFFQGHTPPLEMYLYFGNGQRIGAVTFHAGKVLAGNGLNQKQIATYADAQGSVSGAHRVTIRADLVSRTFRVTFQQGGQPITSADLPFPAGTGAIPAGMQQVTARLWTTKTYSELEYLLAVISLNGGLAGS